MHSGGWSQLCSDVSDIYSDIDSDIDNDNDGDIPCILPPPYIVTRLSWINFIFLSNKIDQEGNSRQI